MDIVIKSKYGTNRPVPDKGSGNTLPTEVLPNQSYTLRELIARYRCGQRLPVAIGSNSYDDDALSEVPLERSPEFSMEDASMYRAAVERRIALRKEFSHQDPSSDPAKDPKDVQGSTAVSGEAPGSSGSAHVDQSPFVNG